MKIGDFLYFAPGIRFDALDLDSLEIVQHFRSRIRGYYLEPARILADQGHAFGAVVILASAIDALAHFESPRKQKNRIRYTRWTQKHVPSLSSIALAEKFYDDFRCGVVHEGRAKRGCVFTTEIGQPVFVDNGLMAVHPVLFWDEITQVQEAFCTRTSNTPKLLKEFQTRLREDFTVEIPAPVVVAVETNPAGS